MKISVNDAELYTLTDIQKDVIKNDINSDIFDTNMEQRLQWVLTHKYSQCFKRLKTEWDPKLTALGHQTIPTDPDEYAALVFAEETYKDRKTRDDEAAAQ